MPELEGALVKLVGERRRGSRGVRPARITSVLGVAASVAIVAVISIVALGLHRSSKGVRQGASTASSGLAASLHLWVGSPGGVIPPTQLGPRQYWYVRTLLNEPVVFPLPGTGRPPQVARASQELVLERWIGRAGEASRSVRTPVGPLRFASPQDQARWNAAGSPNRFPDNGRSISYAFQTPGPFGDFAKFSYADLQALPTEPNRLIRRIQARLTSPGVLRHFPNDLRRHALAIQTSQTILSLLEAPAPAPIHAGFLAAARLLAGTKAHAGNDGIGRRGIVLQLFNGGGGAFIIKATSGALLADGPVGGLDTYLAAGLVNSSSALPQGFPRVVARGGSTAPPARGSAATKPSAHPPTTAGGPNGHAALTELINHFAVLRRSQSAAGPERPGNNLPASGLDVKDRRYIPIDSAFGVWFTPGAGQACLDWPLAASAEPQTGAGVCNSNLADVEAGGLFGEASDTTGSGLPTFVDVVPDGTRIVTITLANGQVERLTPHNNLVSVAEPSTKAQPFESLRIESASGRVTTWCRTCRSPFAHHRTRGVAH
jgi:hypothetical protein